MQCCTCSKWVHLKCLPLSFSRFITLGSSHSWSCPPCCISASSGDPIPTNTVISSSDFSSLYTSTSQSGPSGPLCYCSAPTPSSPSNLLSPFRPLPIFSFCTLTTASYFWLFFLQFLFPLPPDSLRVLQWNAGGLRARSTELLHFISSHPIDPICIQKSNLNLSSSFRIHGFSALRSDCTHSRSGIFSTDATHASGGIIIFVRQGLSFSELSISFLSSLDSYSGYVRVNISPNDFSSLSFLNAYAPFIHCSPRDSRADSFSPSILPIFRNPFILGNCNYHHPHWNSKGISDPVGAIAPLALAPLLTSPLLPPLLLLGGASGPGF